MEEIGDWSEISCTVRASDSDDESGAVTSVIERGTDD